MTQNATVAKFAPADLPLDSKPLKNAVKAILFAAAAAVAGVLVWVVEAWVAAACDTGWVVRGSDFTGAGCCWLCDASTCWVRRVICCC